MWKVVVWFLFFIFVCRIEEELGDKARFAGQNFRKPIWRAGLSQATVYHTRTPTHFKPRYITLQSGRMLERHWNSRSKSVGCSMNVFLCQLNTHLPMLWHPNNSTDPLSVLWCFSLVLYQVWSSNLESSYSVICTVRSVTYAHCVLLLKL